jgi:hypothetical protein
MPQTSGLLSRLKTVLVPRGRKAHRLRGSALSGLLLYLDLHHQSQVLVGLYEREIHGWLRRLATAIDFAVDVGAADGLYTLYFHQRTGARSIFSLEPDPVAFAALERNLSLNGIRGSHRLSVQMASVSATPGPACVSLDLLLQDEIGRGLIKVDVDGGELEVLHGASRLLLNPGVGWLIETHSLELELECLALLHDAGLETSVIPNAWWRAFLPEQRPIEHNRWLAAFHPGDRSLARL